LALALALNKIKLEKVFFAFSPYYLTIKKRKYQVDKICPP